MDSLLRPVGPSSPAIYWRRRVVAALVLVIVSYFLVRACTAVANGDDTEPTSQSTLSTAEATVSPPSDQPTGGGTPSTPAGGDPSASEPTETAATGEPAEVSGGGGDTAPGYCSPENIRLDVRPDKREYAASGKPIFTLLVINVGPAPCQLDVGPAGWSIEITSGDLRIWSSEHCAGEQAKDVQTLDRLTPTTIEVEWNRTRSEQGCPTGSPPAEAGTYTVTASAGETTSPKAIFVLT